MGGYGRAITAARKGNGYLEVFYRGTDDHIYHRWQQPSGWSAETLMGGGALDVGMEAKADGRLEVFYTGTDNKNRHTWQN